jgi:RNA polymerase sigma-70 factor (ECF subfamily)
MENAKIIDLVKKISEERNEIAFSEIFDFIAPKINAYYLKNNLTIEQAEELTQEVLSTIWLKAKLFDPEKSKFITWSFTIARNKKIDFYRKNKKNDVNEEDIRDFLYENNKSDDYELESTIDNITQELDENQKTLIKMSFFEQKSHKNIAAELEIPLGTVKSRIRASLNKMQKHII